MKRNTLPKIEDREAQVTAHETTYARAMVGGSGKQETSDSSKVLGTNRDTSMDELMIDTGALVDNSMDSFTKRSIPRTTARIYHPLEIIAPVVLPMKLLFQMLLSK